MKFIAKLVLIAICGIGVAQATDWRKTGNQGQQVQQLVRSLPGAAHVMFEVGERYKNVRKAVKTGNWEFAAYQAEEIESLIKRLQITRPKRAATAAVFLDKVFPDMHEVIASKNEQEFDKAFEGMRQQCMNCHVKNNHAFITLPVPETAISPVFGAK